ncbi:hypothetical protein ACLBX9_09745 [Methylobacterium sp. A49B]
MTETMTHCPDNATDADPAVLVVTTVEGQRVGIPIGVNALEHLRGIVEAGLRVVQEEVGGAEP